MSGSCPQFLGTGNEVRNLASCLQYDKLCVLLDSFNACVSFWKLVLVTNRKKGVWVRSVPEWSEGRADWTWAYLLSATINSCWLSHSQESYLPFSSKSPTPRSLEWKNNENVWNNVGLLAFSSGSHPSWGLIFWCPQWCELGDICPLTSFISLVYEDSSPFVAHIWVATSSTGLWQLTLMS